MVEVECKVVDGIMVLHGLGLDVEVEHGAEQVSVVLVVPVRHLGAGD